MYVFYNPLRIFGWGQRADTNRGSLRGSKTRQAASDNIALSGAYGRAREDQFENSSRRLAGQGSVCGEMHHRHDDDGSQQEHQIVEPVVRWVRPVASTPHTVTVAPVIVPAPTIMPPRNDIWPSDRVTDDCAACGPERP